MKDMSSSFYWCFLQSLLSANPLHTKPSKKSSYVIYLALSYPLCQLCILTMLSALVAVRTTYYVLLIVQLTFHNNTFVKC